jgi:hypothetical protein
MSTISSLGANDPILAALLQPSNASSASSASAATSTSANPASDTASISGPGQLLSSLLQLQQSNPAQFQQVTAQIANQLQTAAQQQTSPAASNFLTQLSGQFQQASTSGSVSPLEGTTGAQGAAGAAHGHHHHHHGGGYDSSGQATSSSSDASSSPLQQLFSTISNEVTSAVSSLAANAIG